MRRDAAGDFDVIAFLQLARDIFRTRLAATKCGGELVGERVDAFAGKLRQLLLAFLDQGILGLRLFHKRAGRVKARRRKNQP